MPRTVLWLMAAGAVVTAAVLGEAWRGEPGEPAILGQAAKAATTSPAAPAASPPVDAATPQTAAPPSVPPPTVAMPSFDIALIGRDGRGVIAGRAQPGAKVILLDGDKELAQDQADANGEWVIVAQDPPLSAAPVTSDQVGAEFHAAPTAGSEPPPAAASEDKPPTVEGTVLSSAQLRYCLAQSVRIDGAGKAANAASQIDIDRFNALVADYNARCPKARYRESIMSTVKADVEARRTQLEREGAALIRSPYSR
jgi:hypothetical protein